MLDNLRDYRIILASNSPRRRELLQMLGIPFKVISITGIDETYPDNIPPLEIPQFLSIKKADACQEMITGNDIVITADTLVICGNDIMGKPHSVMEAIYMLKELSGKTHQVATGVTVSTKVKRISFTTITDVSFAPLRDEEIQFYIDNFHPFDKAGAYGIQEWIGAVAVSRINGSYYNVMGLPVHRLFQELKNF